MSQGSKSPIATQGFEDAQTFVSADSRAQSQSLSRQASQFGKSQSTSQLSVESQQNKFEFGQLEGEDFKFLRVKEIEKPIDPDQMPFESAIQDFCKRNKIELLVPKEQIEEALKQASEGYYNWTVLKYIDHEIETVIEANELQRERQHQPLYTREQLSKVCDEIKARHDFEFHKVVDQRKQVWLSLASKEEQRAAVRMAELKEALIADSLRLEQQRLQLTKSESLVSERDKQWSEAQQLAKIELTKAKYDQYLQPGSTWQGVTSRALGVEMMPPSLADGMQSLTLADWGVPAAHMSQYAQHEAPSSRVQPNFMPRHEPQQYSDARYYHTMTARAGPPTYYQPNSHLDRYSIPPSMPQYAYSAPPTKPVFEYSAPPEPPPRQYLSSMPYQASAGYTPYHYNSAAMHTPVQPSQPQFSAAQRSSVAYTSTPPVTYYHTGHSAPPAAHHPSTAAVSASAHTTDSSDMTMVRLQRILGLKESLAMQGQHVSDSVISHLVEQELRKETGQQEQDTLSKLTRDMQGLEPFSGSNAKESVLRFLRQFENFVGNTVDSRQKLGLLTRKLTGDALVLAENKQSNTYDELRNHLVEHFQRKPPELWNTLATCRQITTAREYTNRFNTILCQFEDGFDAERAIDMYIKGLKEQFRISVFPVIFGVKQLDSVQRKVVEFGSHMEHFSGDERQDSNRSGDYRGQIRCYECGEAGHTRDRCPKLQQQQPATSGAPTQTAPAQTQSSQAQSAWQPRQQRAGSTGRPRNNFMGINPEQIRQADLDESDDATFELLALAVSSEGSNNESKEQLCQLRSLLLAETEPVKRGPGRPKIYSDDDVHKVRVSQSLPDRLKLDKDFRNNALATILHIMRLESDDAKVQQHVAEVLSTLAEARKLRQQQTAPAAQPSSSGNVERQSATPQERGIIRQREDPAPEQQASQRPRIQHQAASYDAAIDSTIRVTSPHKGFDLLLEQPGSLANHRITAYKDEGAQNSIISQSLADEIGLRYEKCNETFDGVGNVKSGFAGIARDCKLSFGTPTMSQVHDLRVSYDNGYLCLIGLDITSGKCKVLHQMDGEGEQPGFALLERVSDKQLTKITFRSSEQPPQHVSRQQPIRLLRADDQRGSLMYAACQPELVEQQPWKVESGKELRQHLLDMRAGQPAGQCLQRRSPSPVPWRRQFAEYRSGYRDPSYGRVGKPPDY